MNDNSNTDTTRIFAVANQKGGVGKTTTSINLAACMAERGKRVLLVDMDPQANATTGLGVDPQQVYSSMYHVLLEDKPIDSVLEATTVNNLVVAPSSLDLASAEIQLFNVFRREQRLATALEPIKGDFDYIFVDCPPTLGLLTINAFSAVTEVLIPIQCEYYALEGVAQLTRAMEEIKVHLNPSLEISTVVLVMYDSRTNLSRQVVHEVRQMFQDRVCTQMVPRSVQLAEAPAKGLPITLAAPTSVGARAYKMIAREIDTGEKSSLEEGSTAAAETAQETDQHSTAMSAEGGAAAVSAVAVAESEAGSAAESEGSPGDLSSPGTSSAEAAADSLAEREAIPTPPESN